MTREGPEESEATTGSSERSSGEERTDDPRDSEPSDDPKDEEASREDFYREVRTDGGDDIPLNIAGHDDRERPGADSSSSDAGGREETVLEFSESDGDEPATDDEEDEDEAEEVEPVELLVQLAEEGEIDPWDIDIVRVTDRFLEALDDADLRTSGRALFYASVLLRMKSDALFATDEPDEEEELPPWEAPFADDAGGPMDGGDGEAGGHPPGFDPVESLEAEMERRLERKHARGKPETLDELVRELRSAERDSWWKESRSYDTSDSPRGYDRGMQELNYHTEDQFRVDDEPTSDDVTHTTHEEDIETVIDDVEDALEEHYENGRDEVLYAEIDEVGGSRVMTYLALLFLAHRGRIELEQDELFGDLWIRRPTLEAEADEAIAD